MDCTLIHAELVGYHLAAVSAETRDAIDAHLLGCTECLRAYLRLKSALDRSGEERARPSDAVRLRVRADVERMFRPTWRARAARWLARPVPLYQGLALAALVVVADAAVLPRVRALFDRGAVVTAPRVDSARTEPESLGLF